MTKSFQVACIQTCSSNDIEDNIATVDPMIREAHDRGADLVMLPETVSLMETRAKHLFATIRTEEDDPALKAFQALAAELKLWLHTGSLPLKLSLSLVTLEKITLSRGDDTVVCKCGAKRIGIAICADIDYPCDANAAGAEISAAGVAMTSQSGRQSGGPNWRITRILIAPSL